MAPIPPDVQAYIDDIAPEHRALWDRIERLVRVLHPDVELILTYDMPTFVVGEHRLPVGVWKHGVSIYGVHEDNDAGFITRHPELSSGRGDCTDIAVAAAMRHLVSDRADATGRRQDFHRFDRRPPHQARALLGDPAAAHRGVGFVVRGR